MNSRYNRFKVTEEALAASDFEGNLGRRVSLPVDRVNIEQVGSGIVNRRTEEHHVIPKGS
ncbi:hypothetical protein H0178_37235 [Cytobacillus firmus]|nr:hypothetical protein [Cytobacillus firmus]